jgi:hypothetical protein
MLLFPRSISGGVAASIALSTPCKSYRKNRFYDETYNDKMYNDRTYNDKMSKDITYNDKTYYKTKRIMTKHIRTKGKKKQNV